MENCIPKIENGIMEEVEIKIEYPDIEEIKNNDLALEDARLIKERELMIENPTYNLWTSKATACLISKYKKYRSMVGQTNQLRSLRDMFNKISIEMQKQGFYFTAHKCENKWKVLERKYKTLLLREAIKNPGRVKDFGQWEHRKVMDEIYKSHKKSFFHQSGINLSQSLPTDILNNSNQLNLNNGEDILDKSLEESSENQNLKNSTSNNGKYHLHELIKDIKNHLETAEKNKEKRHQEKIALLKNQHSEKMLFVKKNLKIKERLLSLKEERLELDKKKINAIAKML